MPFLPHLRYVVGGNLGSNTPAPETWSCTINVGGADGSHHVVEQAMADDFWTSWNTNMMPLTELGAAVSLEYTKVSAIDATGHVVGAVMRHDEHDQAGGTTYQLPFQCATVVSLRTGLRGPSKRGRFYVPTTNIPSDYTNGETSGTHALNVLGGAVQVLQDLAAYGGGVDKIIVASSKGYNTPVNAVTVGRVVDTQRRRRRSLTEDYLTPVSI